MVLVKFGQSTSSAALVTFVGADGLPLPVGSVIELGQTSDTYIVGYDGQAYLSNLSPNNIASVTEPDGTRCRATFPYRRVAGTQVLIAAAPCVRIQDIATR